MRLSFFGLIVLGFGPSLCSVTELKAAERNVKEYREWTLAAESSAVKSDDKRELQLYVGGIAEGIEWANAKLEFSGQPRLFCPPPNLGLNVQNYISMIDRQIEKSAKRVSAEKLEHTYIGVLLLDAFIETFPCSSNLPRSKK